RATGRGAVGAGLVPACGQRPPGRRRLPPAHRTPPALAPVWAAPRARPRRQTAAAAWEDASPWSKEEFASGIRDPAAGRTPAPVLALDGLGADDQAVGVDAVRHAG